MALKKEDIAACLTEYGVEKGDTLFIHSSYSSMGAVEGGPQAVIDAFVESAGPGGTIVMPAFTDNLKDPFDPDATKSDVGCITEIFRHQEGVLRSLHPTHSICAKGIHAEELTKGHELSDTACGLHTPFAALVRLDAKIILLGVDLNRNTLLHAAEEAAHAKYLVEYIEVPAPVYDRSGKTKLRIYGFPFGHREFIKFTSVLRNCGILKEGCIGHAQLKIMRAKGTFDAALRMMEEDPAYFLCSNPFCNSCVNGRNHIFNTEHEVRRDQKCLTKGCEICDV